MAEGGNEGGPMTSRLEPQKPQTPPVVLTPSNEGKDVRTIRVVVEFEGGEAGTARGVSVNLPIPPGTSVFAARSKSVSSSGETTEEPGKAHAEREPHEAAKSLLESTADIEDDRSQWLARVMQKHPEILELRECLRPISRATTFGQLYNAGKTEVKETLTQEKILELVMQYLNANHLRLALRALEEETHMKYSHKEVDDNRLVSLVRIAVKDTQRIWDQVLVDKHDDGKDREVENVGDYLADLGLQEDEEDTEDVNIYEEPSVDEGGLPNIVLMDTVDAVQVKAATLNKLVEKLTSETGSDPRFMKTFLATYRSFTTPEKLLEKLRERFHVRKYRSRADVSDTDELAIHVRVGNVLKKWVETYFFDFNDKLLRRLDEFVNTTLNKDKTNAVLQLARQISKTIEKKLHPTDNEGEKLYSHPPPPPNVPRNIFSPTLDIFDVDEEEIARQLCLIEFQTHSSIRPAELLNQAWNKPKYRHRSPNVLAMTRRFNDISWWVSEHCVQPKLKDRVKYMSKFIRIIEHLRSFNNFNTIMAFIAGLTNSAVFRLKITKEELKPKTQETLNELLKTMSSDGSFKEYRKTIQTANPPLIPYLGVFLTDLTFIEDGSPDKIRNNLINFHKRQQVYDVLDKVHIYQQQPYNFLPVSQIADLLKKIPHRTAEEVDKMQRDLYAKSLEFEPRNVEREEVLRLERDRESKNA